MAGATPKGCLSAGSWRGDEAKDGERDRGPTVSTSVENRANHGGSGHQCNIEQPIQSDGGGSERKINTSPYRRLRKQMEVVQGS